METTAPIIHQQPTPEAPIPAPPLIDWQPAATQSPQIAAQPTQTYWQPPSAALPEIPGLAAARERLVGLVAALVIQATIAAIAVLPSLPGAPPDESGQPGFWVQFALVELIVAAVISFAYGPGVRIGDLPWVARMVLALAFVIVPAAALAAGAWAALEDAAARGSDDLVSTGLATAFFATIFFGLPLIALAAPGSRRRVDDDRPG